MTSERSDPLTESRPFISDEALWCFANFVVQHVDTVRAKDMPFMRHVLAGFMDAYPAEVPDA